MDRNPVIDKYAKAKIEEPNPNLPLHMSLLKPDEDPEKAMQLAEAVASGETLARKLHRIRNKELVKFIEKDFEGLKDIHVISEATIGVIADAESNLLSHSFLDLVGTVDEVKLAEEHIIDNVLKVCRVLGTYGSSLLKIEMESGAWIKIEQGPSPGVWEWERVVNIFGPRENVNKAKSIIQSVISDKPGELSALEALNEFLLQFKEPSCVELIDYKKCGDGESDRNKKQKVEGGGWSQTFVRIKKSDRSKQTEVKKEQHEFKEPNWSETFGRVISCRKETEQVKDKEYSGESEEKKDVGDKKSEDVGKKMEQDSDREKYAKAKIEEPNVRLPKATLKPDGDPLDDHLCYMKIFDDTQKAQQVVEIDASGAKLDRKVYRIRNKELVKVLGDDFQGMMEIQRISKATIGILANAESDLRSHSYLDLVGSIEEVTTAEELILDKVLKVVGVLGTSGSNLLWIEMESGAWIKIEPGPSPGGSEWETTVKVFGPRDHVNKAISLIHSVISEPGELSAAEALNELLHHLKEPSCVELIEGQTEGELEKEKQKKNQKEAHWSRFFELIDSRNPVSLEFSKQWESEIDEKKKQKYKEARRRRFLKRKKLIYGESTSKGREVESEKEKTQYEFKGRIWSQTYLRIKESGGDAEKRKQQPEFKEPTWSQTFGSMKSGGGESGGSKQSCESERQEDVDQEVDSAKPEDEKEGDESKERKLVDVEEASKHKESEDECVKQHAQESAG
ncbi:hypothetical protein L1887_40268 [Cichorium endivia]|nr:hypothetical protein L1887_40268 [Cichorium endivia]